MTALGSSCALCRGGSATSGCKGKRDSSSCGGPPLAPARGNELEAARATPKLYGTETLVANASVHPSWFFCSGLAVRSPATTLLLGHPPSADRRGRLLRSEQLRLHRLRLGSSMSFVRFDVGDAFYRGWRRYRTGASRRWSHSTASSFNHPLANAPPPSSRDGSESRSLPGGGGIVGSVDFGCCGKFPFAIRLAADRLPRFIKTDDEHQQNSIKGVTFIFGPVENEPPPAWKSHANFPFLLRIEKRERHARV